MKDPIDVFQEPRRRRMHPEVPQRFFLAQDEWSRWFLVPASKRVAWEVWLGHGGRVEVPAWAQPLSGGPEEMEFEHPLAVPYGA